jgi:hypothetical protein
MIHNYHDEPRTYSSVAEAFKTADYATGLWRCTSTRWDRVRALADWLGVFLIVFGFGYLMGRFL